jgi:hypothetical protein
LFNDRNRQNKSHDETYKNATSAFLKTAKVENSHISCIFSIKFNIKHCSATNLLEISSRSSAKTFFFKFLKYAGVKATREKFNF